MILIKIYLKDNDAEFYKEILTGRMTNLETALHSVGCDRIENDERGLNVDLGTR